MAELLQAIGPTARCSIIRHPKTQSNATSRWEEGSTLVKGLVLGSLPDGKAEGDLVDKVSKVVDEVQAAVVDTTHEVTEEVASRVDGPTCSDDEAHCAE